MELEDSSSPDEKEFPGLYDRNSSKSKKTVDESELTLGDNNLASKKSKDSKDKKGKEKRQCYEALGGESEDEEAKFPSSRGSTTESKLFRSPSKKSKTFKFAKKDKREKSREPESKDDGIKEKKIKEDPKADKKKVKKEKKSKSNSLTSSDAFELAETLHPIFGVSLGLSVERSRCHDGVNIPLVVRDCIDYLEEHGLRSEQIYKTDGVKSRLYHLKKCYNSRESQGEELDVPTACSLLKNFLQELPEPILTTELTTRFEEASALPDVETQAAQLESLIEQLPKCNQVLLAWISRHFSNVIDNEKYNKLNAQSLAVLLSPVLQMSHRLTHTILCHAETLFADIVLQKYVPPVTSTSPNFPDAPEEISTELCKQESLLSQIHSEMNAGFVTKKREEELWETQRIITQLKRKLRTFEKRNDSMQKSMDIEVEESIDFTLRTTEPEVQTEETILQAQEVVENEISHGDIENLEEVYESENGLLMLHKDHPDYLQLIRLQFENKELMKWKQELQERIKVERAECVRLKRVQPTNESIVDSASLNSEDPDYDKLVEFFSKENSLLEQKRTLLAREILEENISLIQLQVDLAMKKFISE